MPILCDIFVPLCFLCRRRGIYHTTPRVVQGDQIEIHNITMEPALQIPNPATAPNPPQPPPYQILPGNDPVPSPYTPLQFQARPNILATYEDVDDDVMAHVSVHTSSENGSDGSTVGAAEGVIYE